MKDFLTAILGGKHCGWCCDKPPTRWDRFMRFDMAMKTVDRHWWERAAMRLEDFSFWLGVWKLGQRWHYRFHPQDETPSACDTCPACQELEAQ